MRSWIDRLVRALSRLVIAVFYRDVEVQGLENVPLRGPAIFVANHGNAIVDPVVLAAALPRLPRFLAKHTLWKNPAVRPLLELAGGLPVYRAVDGSTSRNRETFSRIFEELAGGCAIALFPEGISHHEPELQPLRTGAARMALGAAARGAGPVAIVPVGLTFEDKTRFRSRLLVTVGEPIVPEAEDDEDDSDTVRDLTARIDAGLRAVTLNHPSWEAARLVERAAEIYAGDEERALPGRPALADHFSLRRAFGEGFDAARAKHPERVAALEALAQRYDGMLEALRLRDDHITASYPWTHVLGYVSDRLWVLALTLPVAALGALIHYIPYRLPGVVAHAVRDTPDQPATYKLLGGFFLFPFFWATASFAAGQLWGHGAALLAAVLVPASGWIALRFHERNESFWNELRAWLVLRLAPERADTLRTLRRRIREGLKEVVEAS